MADIPPTATASSTSTSTGTAAATASAPAEMLKTQPAGSPAAGGWAPNANTPMWAAVLIGVLFGSGPVIGIAVGTWNFQVGIVVGSVLMSVAVSLAGFFGMRSAGPRAP